LAKPAQRYPEQLLARAANAGAGLKSKIAEYAVVAG